MQSRGAPLISAGPVDQAGKYDPAIQQGGEAQLKLRDIYGNLISDPTALMNKISSGYSTSKYAQNQLAELMRVGNLSAAAGGGLGSQYAGQDQAMRSQDLISRDQRGFMNTALGVFGMGVGGEENIANRGQRSLFGQSQYMLGTRAQDEINRENAVRDKEREEEAKRRKSQDWWADAGAIAGAASKIFF